MRKHVFASPKTKAQISGCTAWFVLVLARNLKDRFSHDIAHFDGERMGTWLVVHCCGYLPRNSVARINYNAQTHMKCVEQ